MEPNARQQAEKWGVGLLTVVGTERGQLWAILDLADAVREVASAVVDCGKEVHEGLDNIEAGMAFLTEAIQRLDYTDF